MLQRLIVLNVFLFYSITIFGQAPEKIANDYYQISNYEMALPIYEKLYSKDTNNVEYVYRLGVCHVMLNRDRAKAIPFLEKASKMPKVPDYVWLDLGSAYRYAGQLNKAEECLNKFIAISKNQTEKENARIMLNQLKNAYTLMSNPINVDFINLGDKINSSYDDFFPVVDRKNTWIYYNSARIFNKLEETYVVNVHFSTYKKNRWKSASRAPVVNTAEDNFIVGKSLNDEYLFIKPQQYEIFDDILMSPLNKETISGKAISFPEP
ncbi:MAG TPA: hypothetical protein PK990_07740, partial [Salinivirgaceae bacterium]|nr:hypothetical protein [Salinivirgaceae bacterium]